MKWSCEQGHQDIPQHPFMAFTLSYLSPDLHRQIEADRIERRRLHELTPRWLARYLVTTARVIRTHCRWGPDAPVYDAQLMWHLVPELAYRLGERCFTADERRDRHVVVLTDLALSQRTLSALQNVCAAAYHDVSASRIFLRDSTEGNPIAYGLAHLVASSAQ